jgi:nitrile hydratase subunit beta
VNGVHDMGGMHGLGPIQYERNEPVFHAQWEGRAFALKVAAAAWRKWSLDAFRHQIELIPAADYLRMSYYEKWLTAVTERLVQSGLITHAEVESAKPAPGSSKATPPLTAAQVPAMLRSGALASRNVAATPHFCAGQRVRARNINPLGHTRHWEPWIATTASTFSPMRSRMAPKKIRSTFIRFASPRELWGDQASARDAVYIDLWDDYLEPA